MLAGLTVDAIKLFVTKYKSLILYILAGVLIVGCVWYAHHWFEGVKQAAYNDGYAAGTKQADVKWQNYVNTNNTKHNAELDAVKNAATLAAADAQDQIKQLQTKLNAKTGSGSIPTASNKPTDKNGKALTCTQNDVGKTLDTYIDPSFSQSWNATWDAAQKAVDDVKYKDANPASSSDTQTNK